jgi:phosphopentomutase
MSRRAAIVVLDGVGAGAAPDAAQYGDVGSDTLGNVAKAVGGMSLPHLRMWWQSSRSEPGGASLATSSAAEPP